MQGTSIAVARGGAIVAESLPTLVTELERADRHIQADTNFGIAIGVLIVAGGGYALWRRIKAARQLGANFKRLEFPQPGGGVAGLDLGGWPQPFALCQSL
ncbi:hypothetical protein DLJ53_03010 [Acuticoccus sediminis]|uniref:Uncharacterized protein n=1 Tax=Acuticoccus sediminis TaxID=2184697 RepID=A0A8B2NTG1_9HYPH|nr:hypothetical protein DLJ53_03010 [Acuticoccus sediminis]